MKETGMKKEDTTSIRVSKATRERVMNYLAVLIGERVDSSLATDDAVSAAMDCVEREHNRKK